MSSPSSADSNNADLPPIPMDEEIWKKVASQLALSQQQLRIVELILRGRRDREIAASLKLSFPTVRTYLKRIFDRVGVENRMALVLHIFTMAQNMAMAHCR